MEWVSEWVDGKPKTPTAGAESEYVFVYLEGLEFRVCQRIMEIRLMNQERPHPWGWSRGSWVIQAQGKRVGEGLFTQGTKQARTTPAHVHGENVQASPTKQRDLLAERWHVLLCRTNTKLVNWKSSCWFRHKYCTLQTFQTLCCLELCVCRVIRESIQTRVHCLKLQQYA